MRKKFLSIIIMITAYVNIYAQEAVTMREVFSHMPDTLLPYLSNNSRLDLIDFIESGMVADVTNGFDEHMQLTALSSNYLKLTLSPASSIEMKLLDALDNNPEAKVLCVVSTIGESPVASAVKFYTPKWEILSGIEDPILCNLDRLIACPDTMSIVDFNQLKMSLSPMTAHAVLSEKEETITLVMSFPSGITTEDKDKISPLLRQITLKWSGEHFK